MTTGYVWGDASPTHTQWWLFLCCVHACVHGAQSKPCTHMDDCCAAYTQPPFFTHLMRFSTVIRSSSFSPPPAAARRMKAATSALMTALALASAAAAPNTRCMRPASFDPSRAMGLAAPLAGRRESEDFSCALGVGLQPWLAHLPTAGDVLPMRQLPRLGPRVVMPGWANPRSLPASEPMLAVARACSGALCLQPLRLVAYNFYKHKVLAVVSTV